MYDLKVYLKEAVFLFESSAFKPTGIADPTRRAVFVIMTFIERFEDGGTEGYLLSSYGNCFHIVPWAWAQMGCSAVAAATEQLATVLPIELQIPDWQKREEFYFENEAQCIRSFEDADKQFRGTFCDEFGNSAEERFRKIEKLALALIARHEMNPQANQ